MVILKTNYIINIKYWLNIDNHLYLKCLIAKVDIVIKMGCNVVCPYLPAKHVEDWGLEDPTGKSDEEFIKIAKTIEIKVKELAERIKNNKL